MADGKAVLDQLDEAASTVPEDAHLGLFCGPDVWHAIRAEHTQADNARPSARAVVNLVFTMDARAWRLEQDGEPLADGRMEEP